MNIHPDRAAKGTTLPEHRQSDVDRLRDRVEAIMKKATHLATSTTPDGLLKFYAGIADPYQGYGADPKQRMEQAKLLQKNLGIALGTATLSDSAAMRSWEQKMIKLGPANSAPITRTTLVGSPS
ncbi:hypothetical protein ACWHA3_25065 [Streptomyces cyaneofuscatus]